MSDFTFVEVEQMQEDVKNKQYDKNKLLDMLEGYKWLLEFKPFQDLVDTQPVSTEALYDACQAYFGFKCKLTNEKCNWYHEDGRPGHCLLSPLPKKDEENYFPNEWQDGYTAWWNACLDKILGEENEKNMV